MLQSQTLPSLAQTLPNLSEANVRQVSCVLDGEVLRVRVAYDMSQNFGQIMGRMIGLDVTEFVRDSAIRL